MRVSGARWLWSAATENSICMYRAKRDLVHMFLQGEEDGADDGCDDGPELNTKQKDYVMLVEAHIHCSMTTGFHLLGPPGAGKSTVALYLVTKASRELRKVWLLSPTGALGDVLRRTFFRNDLAYVYTFDGAFQYHSNPNQASGRGPLP